MLLWPTVDLTGDIITPSKQYGKVLGSKSIAINGIGHLRSGQVRWRDD